MSVMTDEQVQEFLTQKNDEAIRGCGLSDVLYSKRYSAAVESLLNRFPPEDHPRLIELARKLGDYADAAELREISQGCCAHGLDPDCCPAGCGDIEDDVEDSYAHTYVPPPHEL